MARSAFMQDVSVVDFSQEVPRQIISLAEFDSSSEEDVEMKVQSQLLINSNENNPFEISSTSESDHEEIFEIENNQYEQALDAMLADNLIDLTNPQLTLANYPQPTNRREFRHYLKFIQQKKGDTHSLVQVYANIMKKQKDITKFGSSQTRHWQNCKSGVDFFPAPNLAFWWFMLFITQVSRQTAQHVLDFLHLLKENKIIDEDYDLPSSIAVIENSRKLLPELPTSTLCMFV